jgi:Pup amidohydrolase
MSVRLLGMETEYGIIREDMESSDPVEESMKLLQACKRKSVFGKWAYSQENSHLDMRGFKVKSLAQDEEEDAFCAEDRKRPYSYIDMKCDRVLKNGARFYNDHTHPEYSTPECRSVLSLVAHDVAGERIVAECVTLRNRELEGNPLQVFKNNTDYSGHSYGTHDNYLIPRETPFEDLVKALVPFLVTRQLYAGAGKVGSESAKDFQGLQLAQRSDFIETVLSIETMTNRPLINTRDEPHATKNQYRRLHLILGDANMSAYATALKVGSTSLVLNLIANRENFSGFELADPVSDVLKLSLDKTQVLQRKTGGTITALEIQEAYLEAAEKAFSGKDLEWDWIIAEWKRTMDELRHSPEKLSDRIDWAIKEKLFTEFMQIEGIGWEDPLLKSLDLEYHNLDPDRGLYLGLQQGEEVYSLLNEQEIVHAIESPPEGTRAQIRGQAVSQDAGNIESIHWTRVEFSSGEILDLTGVIGSEEVEKVFSTRKQLV